ncbi:MAG: hypothetical protein ABSA74_02375 [Candidatus Staskawiczbacteria bacterium]|jgi:CheY-like chemotaxis protein
MRILLVDDNLKHRRAGVKQLSELGHEAVPLFDYGMAEEVISGQPFDAALIDLLMPAEPTTLGPQACAEWVGKEIGVGFPLVLYLSGWIKMIAVATDTNHHAHPMSAIVDWFHGKALSVNGARVLIMHSPMCNDGTKDWAKVLAELLAK